MDKLVHPFMFRVVSNKLGSYVICDMFVNSYRSPLIDSISLSSTESNTYIVETISGEIYKLNTEHEISSIKIRKELDTLNNYSLRLDRYRMDTVENLYKTMNNNRESTCRLTHVYTLNRFI
jgi:hypothetical protein